MSIDGMSTLSCGALSALTLASVLATAGGASAAEPVQLERNNNWTVEISNKPTFMTPPIFVTLRLVGTKWEIVGVYERPPLVPRSEPLELLVASRDLQKWGNAFANRVANCDSFEAKESNFHSICTSVLSEKQSESSAAFGLLLGGTGSRPVIYNVKLVTAVVQSISPDQALRALSEFEKNLTR